MRKFIFIIIGILSLGFFSCVPGPVTPVKEINYTVPIIINEDFESDFGLFSPYEAPLVQGREYEFTATTVNHRYIFLLFEIEDPETKIITEKWISLKKLEANIFSQNIKIPNNAKLAKIGASDDKNHNNVIFYAVYNIIRFDDFIDVIKEDEARRENEEKIIPKEELGPAADSYTKIVIDHKYDTKYPVTLKCGETYIFEIGPFESSYCIFNTMNGDNISWLPIESNENKIFKLVYQIPVNAQEFRICLASSPYNFNESIVSFYLEESSGRQKTAEITEEKNILIQSASMGEYDIQIDDETIYKMTVGPFSMDYNFCYVEMFDVNDESLDYFVLEKSDDIYETNCLYIPEGTKYISVALTNRYFTPTYSIARFNVNDIDDVTPFKIGKNFKKAHSYKTSIPDEEIIDYLTSISAKKLGRQNPDLLIEMCCKKVQELAEDDFEMMKLVHDTIWYLASYDYDNLAAGGYDPWDYKTILSKNLCVCAGYSRLYTYFCEKLGIRSIFVIGNSLDGSERTFKDIETVDHAWSMIEIEGEWYLSDLTWDCSGTEYGICDDFYSCDYFFVKPEEFIKTHYPMNPEKQLFEIPYTSEDMIDLLRN